MTTSTAAAPQAPASPQRRLQTEIPGPVSRALQERRANAVAAGVASTLPAYITSASGGLLTDADGNVLIDFGSGIAVTSVGHSAPEVAGLIPVPRPAGRPGGRAAGDGPDREADRRRPGRGRRARADPGRGRFHRARTRLSAGDFLVVQGETGVIGDVRGRGAMLAAEFVKPGTNEPDADLTKRIAAACHAQGVVVLTCGTYGNVVRLLPPLSLSNELLDEGLAVLEYAIRTEARK